MSYQRDLKIDRYKLDSELVRQPQLYMTWALKSVDASIEKDEAKNRLDIVKSEIDSRIRATPERYGLDERPTEPAIKAAIAKHPKVKRYTRLYFRALRNDRLLSKAEIAFNHRKKMLEGLVSLNIQLNFADPRVPSSVKEARYQNKRKDINASLKRRLNRRRRQKDK